MFVRFCRLLCGTQTGSANTNVHSGFLFFLTRHKNILFLNNGWLHTETGVWEGQKTFCSALLVRHHLSLSGLFFSLSSSSSPFQKAWTMKNATTSFHILRLMRLAGWQSRNGIQSLIWADPLKHIPERYVRWKSAPAAAVEQGSIRVYKNRWDAHLSKLGCTKETY